MTQSSVTTVSAAFNPLMAGRLGLAIAVGTVLAIVMLGLLYAGLPIFGPINDLTNAGVALLSALLAWQFHALVRERAPGVALLILLLAWAGSAAIIGNSLLVAIGRLHWMTGGMYTALGLGLQGAWLLVLLRLAGPQALLTTGLIRLGTLAAAGMLFGFAAGPLLVRGASQGGNWLTYVAYAGAAAGYLLYPLWCWLVGRLLLK